VKKQGRLLKTREGGSSIFIPAHARKGGEFENRGSESAALAGGNGRGEVEGKKGEQMSIVKEDVILP